MPDSPDLCPPCLDFEVVDDSFVVWVEDFAVVTNPCFNGCPYIEAVQAVGVVVKEDMDAGRFIRVFECESSSIRDYNSFTSVNLINVCAPSYIK